MVVALDGGTCVLLPDSRTGELRVLAKDLTEAKDSGTGIETLGGKYELHDLVQLDAHTAGVIIAIEADSARVLTSASTAARQDVRLCKVWIIAVDGRNSSALPACGVDLTDSSRRRG